MAPDLMYCRAHSAALRRREVLERQWLDSSVGHRMRVMCCACRFCRAVMIDKPLPFQGRCKLSPRTVNEFDLQRGYNLPRPAGLSVHALIETAFDLVRRGARVSIATEWNGPAFQLRIDLIGPNITRRAMAKSLDLMADRMRAAAKSYTATAV